MRLIVSDIEEILSVRESDLLLSPQKEILPCTGCYHCWIKTPGVCVLKDGYTQLPAMLAEANELVMISRLVYGGLSPTIKNVLDRSLGYMLPFFELKEGYSHHPMRYDHSLRWKVFFYGGSEGERGTARKIISANARNLEIEELAVYFADSRESLSEVLHEHLSN